MMQFYSDRPLQTHTDTEILRMVYNQRSTTQTITDNTQAQIGASLYLGTLLQSQCDRTDRLTDRQTNIDLVWILQHTIDKTE